MLFKKKVTLKSLGEGEALQLDQCIDPVFKEKMVGDGYLFIPSTNQLYAPISGKVTMISPTNHAIGITDKNGLEILVHVGIESVGLEEQLIFFQVQEGEEINAGQLLANIELAKLELALPSIQTPVLFTNLTNQKLKITKTGTVNLNDIIVELK